MEIIDLNSGNEDIYMATLFINTLNEDPKWPINKNIRELKKAIERYEERVEEAL